MSFFNSLDSDILFTAIESIGEIVRAGPLPFPDSVLELKGQSNSKSASESKSELVSDIKVSLTKESIFLKVVERMEDSVDENTMVMFMTYMYFTYCTCVYLVIFVCN